MSNVVNLGLYKMDQQGKIRRAIVAEICDRAAAFGQTRRAIYESTDWEQRYDLTPGVRRQVESWLEHSRPMAHELELSQ